MFEILLSLAASWAGATEPGATLRLALPTQDVQLDPHKYEDMYSMVIINQVYSRLFRYSPDGQVRTDAVTSWEVSPDKTIYTFKLGDLKFSDGTEITASHVANSLKRIFLLKASIASDLSLIAGAKEALKTGKPERLQVAALDGRTLRIQTSAPTSLLLYLLAVPDCAILKLDRPDQKIDFKSTQGPFSGTYKITAISTSEISLEKWRPSALESSRPPARARIQLHNRVSPKLAAKGEISDTSSFMTFDDQKSPFENLKGWRAVISEASNERFLVLNPKALPENVRQWLSSK
ncbi:MAG: hypothetical protein HC883_03750 [Bdellovibrionaceae bacterium]|nr:hypothetical protein [Pseudobdellovibrionaceae bacterium]